MIKRKNIFSIVGAVIAVLSSCLIYIYRGVLIERTVDTVIMIVVTLSLTYFYIFSFQSGWKYGLGTGFKIGFGAIVFLSYWMFWGYGLSRILSRYGLFTVVAVGLIMLVWQIWMTLTALNFIELLRNKISKIHKTSVSNKTAFLIIFLIMMAGALTATRVFYPGVISSDNMAIYTQALAGERSDIHSFALILLVKLLTLLSDNYYIITLFFAISFSLAWANMMMTLYSYGFPLILCGVVSVVFIFVPTNFILFAATWKDIPFCICMLLLTTSIIKMVFEDFHLAVRDVVLLIVGLTGSALFRSNGQVVLIVCSIVFLIIWARKRHKNLIITVLVSVGVLILFKGPVFYLLDVDRGGDWFTSIPFLDGVWENIHAGNELDEETKNYIEDLMPIERFEYAYAESYYNISAVKAYGNSNKISLNKSIKAYLKCLQNYPGTTLKARAKKTFNLWSVFPSDKYLVNYNLAADISQTVSRYGFDWKYPPQYESMRMMLMLSLRDDLNVYLLFIRGSHALAMSLLLGLYFAGKGKKSFILIILPAVVNQIALIAACCFLDYRYTWPMFVMTIPFVCTAFINKGAKDTGSISAESAGNGI